MSEDADACRVDYSMYIGEHELCHKDFDTSSKTGDPILRIQVHTTGLKTCGSDGFLAQALDLVGSGALGYPLVEIFAPKPRAIDAARQSRAILMVSNCYGYWAGLLLEGGWVCAR